MLFNCFWQRILSFLIFCFKSIFGKNHPLTLHFQRFSGSGKLQKVEKKKDKNALSPLLLFSSILRRKASKKRQAPRRSSSSSSSQDKWIFVSGESSNIYASVCLPPERILLSSLPRGSVIATAALKKDLTRFYDVDGMLV